MSINTIDLFGVIEELLHLVQDSLYGHRTIKRSMIGPPNFRRIRIMTNSDVQVPHTVYQLAEDVQLLRTGKLVKSVRTKLLCEK